MVARQPASMRVHSVLLPRPPLSATVMETTAQARARLDRWLTPARNALGRRASLAAWAAGQALGADAAIAEALALSAPSAERKSTLTPREREVMTLAARGMTNREIGQQLVIAEGTARVHVGHVLGKLECSRSWLRQDHAAGALDRNGRSEQRERLCTG